MASTKTRAQAPSRPSSAALAGKARVPSVARAGHARQDAPMQRTPTQPPPIRREPSRTPGTAVLRFPEEASGTAGRASAMRSLQRSAGNSRAGRVLNRAPNDLQVTHPQDASERDAEAVAQRVAAGMKAPPIQHLAPGGSRMLPRQATEPAETRSPVPAVSRRPEEEKAFRQAEETDASLSVSRQPEEESASPVSRQREGDDASSPVARQDGAGAAGAGLDTGRAARTLAGKGAGRPFSPPVRQALESRMGADLTAARVHDDSAANEAAAALKARAFTQGQDIYLARGESDNDMHLMAHEATHVVQQSAASSQPVMRVTHRSPAVGGPLTQPGRSPAPPGVVDLKGQPVFPQSAAIDAFLDQQPNGAGQVKVRFGGLAEGLVEIVKRPDGSYSTANPQFIQLLAHPLFEHLPDLRPVLALEVSKGVVTGGIGLDGAARLSGKALKAAPELLGLTGFELPKVPKLPNAIRDGHLHLGPAEIDVAIGRTFKGSIRLETVDEKVELIGSGQLGLSVASGEMKITRSPEGLVTGSAHLQFDLPGDFTGGDIEVVWDGKAIQGTGTAGYEGEKLSGEVIFQVMEKGEAEQLEAAQKAPAEQGTAETPDKQRAGGRDTEYVGFGQGDLKFSFTDWLTGTARVIVDPKGHLTIIGEITPQKEFELFPQKDYNQHLFKVEVRGSYGLPVVGNIFVFANVGMDAFAKLGPAKFYNIVVEGTYSTDPKKRNDLSFRGSLNISAAAGLRLRGEGGAGVEVLDHDVKAGVGVNAMAGIRGYAEATPVIGYREEEGAEGEDKKGVFFIRGDLEIAGQPFLGLGGDLFIEVDSPFWSPLPDKKWTWPLGGQEYPLGGSFGIGASLDYVFGSGEAPALEFKEPEFDSSKFLTDLYSDKAKPKSGDGGEKQGTWKEKNTKDSSPPQGSEKGAAQEGELSKAKASSTVATTSSSSTKSGKSETKGARQAELDPRGVTSRADGTGDVPIDPAAAQAELSRSARRPEYKADSKGRAAGPSGHVKGVKAVGARKANPPPLPARSSLRGYLEGDHRGHLIGDRFYGPPIRENIVPMSRTLNLSRFKVFENAAAKRFEEKVKERGAALLFLSVIPDYSGGDERPEAIEVRGSTTTVKIEGGRLQEEPPVAVPGGGTLRNDPEVKRSEPLTLNNASVKELARLPGIGKVLAPRIHREREDGGPFNTYESVARRVPGVGPKTVEKLKAAIRLN